MMIAAGWAFGLREIAANNLRPTYWIGRKKGPGSSSSISFLIIITTIIVYHRRRLLNVGPGPHHKGTTTISRSNVVVVVVLWNFLRFDHRTFSPPSDDYYQLALRHNSISATAAAAALSQSVYNVLTIGKLQATTCTQGRRRRNNNKRIMISLPDARNV